MATLKNNSQIILKRYSGNIKFVMMCLSVLVITIFLPKHAKFRYEYEKGKIWMHKDLVSPYSYPIKKTNEEILNDKASISKSILPIYQNDTDIPQNEMDAFTADFNVKWKDASVDEKLSDNYKEAGLAVLSEIYRRGILTLNKKYQQSNPNYNFTLLTNNVSRQLNTLDVFTVETALKRAKLLINKSDVIQNKPWLLALVTGHLQPNYVYDERLTDKIETLALNNVSLTRGMVQKGELVAANGSMINSEVYQKLESLRDAYEQEASITGNRQLVNLGQFLLVGLAITLLMVFLNLYRRDIYQDNRQISLILLIITFMLITLSLAIKFDIPSVYFIPYCIVPIIIRILFDSRVALNIHLLVVLIAGFFVPNSFEFAFFQLTAGMVAIYSIKNLVKREQFLISALLIFVNYFIAFLGIAFIREGTIENIDWITFTPFIFSVFLSLLAYPLIYAFEKIFAITSEVTLMEITNTNSKLLRDLSYKAPGTFQHSLQVANLAEAAIFKIGGNALLVRAGALYHDIGKMDNPQYFIENQNKGLNPHDNLSYEQSAQIIIQHVNKGIELAHKHLIPERVIDFIKTHHGNTRVDYFYQSYLKNFPEKMVDEKIFRYPGPIPFSKETAVLMLADSVEAASRTIKEPDMQNINDLVEKIIKYKLDQQQLSNSNITLKDLESIKEIFKAMLMSIYHVRVDYVLQK